MRCDRCGRNAAAGCATAEDAKRCAAERVAAQRGAIERVQIVTVDPRRVSLPFSGGSQIQPVRYE